MPPAKLGRRAETTEANRASILDAARLAFEGLGYHEATLRTIAHNANLTTGAIFSAFPDGKEQIYHCCYGHYPITPEHGRKLLNMLIDHGIDPDAGYDRTPEATVDHEALLRSANPLTEAA